MPLPCWGKPRLHLGEGDGALLLSAQAWTNLGLDFGCAGFGSILCPLLSCPGGDALPLPANSALEVTKGAPADPGSWFPCAPFSRAPG